MVKFMLLAATEEVISNKLPVFLLPFSACLNTAERFDFTKNEWEALPPLQEYRRALSLVALPDGVYAIGGYNGKDYLSSVEK